MTGPPPGEDRNGGAMKECMFWLVLSSVLALAAPGASGQGARPPDPASLQSLARERYSGLVESLSRLSRELRQREPERAALLQAALRFCGEKGLAESMDAVKAALDAQRWQEALDRMVRVEQDLATLLDLLLARNQQLLELLKEIQRLEELAREAERLIKEQEVERDRARESVEKLAQGADPAGLRPSLEEQAKAQEKTAADTARLAEKLGEQPEQGRDPTPGAGKVGEAVPHQNKAAGSLGEGKPGPAVPEQEEALERLKNAKEELEQALEQARRRLQEELLQALEERIAGLLAAQKRISAQTRVLDEQAAGALPPPRAVRMKAGKLGQEEKDLAGEAAQALRLLREEGSTVVIPEIMETVHDDLLLAGAGLEEGRTGVETQTLQEEIETLLAAVLDAIRKTREERREDQDQRNKDDQGNQDQPLVPRSAELRMIRILQNSVYLSTLRAANLQAKEPEAAGRMARDLAAKQARIHELTRRLARRIDKDLSADEEDGR